MLVMFVAGVASLLWMAALTAPGWRGTGPAVSGGPGGRIVPIADAALVLAHPAWLPAAPRRRHMNAIHSVIPFHRRRRSVG
jgi:predicted metal-binding membrane protein